MAVKLYNTLTRAKQELEPVEPGKVKFYVCGPTVYDYIHIGNGRAFVVFDVLRRLLRYLKYDVTYVMNLTDIDDRIIERSIKEGISTEEITHKYTEAFFEDLDALGVERADIHPKATEHVADIIHLIEELVDKGFAYQVDGDVYYDVSKFNEYGKLSGKKLDDLIAGSRVDVDERKRHPFDFALWKAQKPGEPGWESAWGVGRPGWHIECSAMSMKYLGQTFDIHAGGNDLIFPHHENEIAQSEAASQKPFVNHWLHNGFLQIDGTKMAKSLGNFKRVRDIVKVYPTNVIRLFFLQKHYRGPMDFTQSGLEAAKRASTRLNTFLDNLKRVTHGQNGDLLDRASLSEDESKFLDFLDKTMDKFFEAL
ncbi:cysteine--tRNA ligase, partial [bacterium]|nr:cysteine--tRNA ligase [bacterium]